MHLKLVAVDGSDGTERIYQGLCLVWGCYTWALLEDLALYDNESWNDPRDFAKPVKAISLPQDVPITSDRRLIELENQVQHLMEANLAPKQPIQVNKITSSCEICSGPHDTQYCMENPEQAFVKYASSLLEVLAHAPMYNAILDRYMESLELGRNGPAFIQGEMSKRMEDPRLADGTKSYPVGIVRDVEVHIGRLKLINEFYVINTRKDPETPLLVGRGFLATGNAVIDCKNAKIAVGEQITRPKINDKYHFELKGQFLKELRDNTFSGSDHEDANKHIEKVLEIVDLLHIPNINQDQIMLRAFPMSLTGAASCWLRNKPFGLIKTWEDLKAKFLKKYCLPARTAKKMEEINNFQQEPDETLYQAWESLKNS
ncbi:MAK10-like protein [Tanacetum coccineum]